MPKKPPHINTSVLLVPTKVVPPKQVKMRVMRREVDVISNYTNSIVDCRYLDVPQVICINLYPRGK